ncbi:hypothetical protein [Salibacter halophilus]|uniref:Uncharacterized protein n=1 Tax=Salibacter halophilus TaxID=1803916 RepID=A0A6N6M9A8_9FLAO|nr:hypothetical protein [Salibacter halophilus]KAB1065292.1 hypothetical protein F3059_04880 [Salibacter halophilus]
MNRDKVLIILFLVSSIVKAFGCSCPPVTLEQARKKEFTNSTFIVIAEVTEMGLNKSKNAMKFRIQVKENFKGDLQKGENYKILSSMYCGPVIESGTYLLYLSLHDSVISVNSCGLSRSIFTPEKHTAFKTIPPPPPPELFENSLPDSIENIAYQDSIIDDYWESIPDTKEIDKVNARKELEIEIEMLREKF